MEKIKKYLNDAWEWVKKAWTESYVMRMALVTQVAGILDQMVTNGTIIPWSAMALMLVVAIVRSIPQKGDF